MANNTLKVRHKQRYDTEANWKSKDPILLAGEMAISSDKNGRFKVGDGKNKWSVLAYSKADLSKSDVTTALGYTPPTTNTTYSTGTASTAGIGKLYTTTGTATDGSMTQSAITTALNGKSATTHTHNYAGSSSAGGVANSALKLATARTITNNSASLMTFSTSFDGSANVTGSLIPRCSTIGVGNTNNYPYHRVSTYSTSGAWRDAMATLYLTGGYQGAPWGIVNISLRTNSTFSDNSATVQWIVRSGYSPSDVIAALYTASDKVYIDVYVKTTGTYSSQIVQVLAGGNRGSLQQLYTLLNSSEANNTTTTDAKTSIESYSSITAGATTLYKAAYTKTTTGVDAGIVKYASSTDIANSAVKLQTARTINGVSFNGTDNITLTANPTANQLSNQDLNTTTTPAFYYAAGSNSVTNKPSGVDAFGMIVMKNASGYTEQLLIDTNQKFLMRVYNGSSWTAWASVYTTLNKPSKSDVGLGNVENKSSATIRGELTKDNITTALGYTPPTTNTTYVTGTTSTAGITKLYTSTGTGTDGAMTQAATTTALNGKANSSHTHSYAGSSSAGGSATSAVKLDTTTAGSATQPVYFTGGKPTACTYTLGCSVPSGAKFTDTNTWRGIQNNLTSDSTTDSLSAAQGKALKALVDGKANSTHTHNCIVQMGKDSITTKTQDTVENWVKTNNSVHFFSALDELTDQPSQYGFIFNISNGSAEVHQLWMTQSSGNMAHRGGNKYGWDGTWRTILDSTNYSTYALPASKVVASKYTQTDLTTLAGSDWSMLPTLNTLAYWNGRFNSSSSSLAYCKLGAFGSGATKNISCGTAAPSGTANVGDIYIQIS